jgi:hypothetical protein
MSTNLPAARTYGQLKHRAPDWSDRYEVAIEHLSARSLTEYLEFLELVYGAKVRLTKRPDTAFLTLPATGRSAAGLRFVSWVYGVTIAPVKKS